MSWWKSWPVKRKVAEQESYRLMESIEKARKSLVKLQTCRLAQPAEQDMYPPVLLAEVRYRFLLGQARKRKLVNHWYFDMLND